MCEMLLIKCKRSLRQEEKDIVEELKSPSTHCPLKKTLCSILQHVKKDIQLKPCRIKIRIYICQCIHLNLDNIAIDWKFISLETVRHSKISFGMYSSNPKSMETSEINHNKWVRLEFAVAMEDGISSGLTFQFCLEHVWSPRRGLPHKFPSSAVSHVHGYSTVILCSSSKMR